jgi:hypothetical protein
LTLATGPVAPETVSVDEVRPAGVVVVDEASLPPAIAIAQLLLGVAVEQVKVDWAPACSTTPESASAEQSTATSRMIPRSRRSDVSCVRAETGANGRRATRASVAESSMDDIVETSHVSRLHTSGQRGCRGRR